MTNHNNQSMVSKVPAAPEDKDKLVLDVTRQILARLNTQLARDNYWQKNGDFQPVMRRLIAEMTRELGPALGSEANAVFQTAQELVSELGWYGPLQEAMSSEDVTVIIINSPERHFLFEQNGTVRKAPWSVSSEWLRFIVAAFRRRRGLGATLPARYTGAVARPPMRYTWVSGAFAVNGDTLYIRKFRRYPLSLKDQVDSGVLTREAAEFLDMAVKARVNMLVSGGSGAGKTTLTTTLCLSIPRNERVVTVEDEHEIYLEESLDNFVAYELNPEEAETSLSDLLRHVGLKVAPDRVIVGEVRGKEAFDLLQAMNTGVEGSMATIHANSPADGLIKWADYVMMSSNPPPLDVIYSRIAAQRPLVVQIARLPDGKRMVTGIAECVSANKTIFETQALFRLENEALVRTRTPYSNELAARLAPVKQLLESRRSRISQIKPVVPAPARKDAL